MADPATFGVPGPDRAVVMVNNSTRPANAPAPSAGHIAPVRPTNIVISALERQAAAANASGIIDIDQIMPATVNSRNPFKRTFRESARIIVDICNEVNATNIPPEVLNDILFKGLDKYQKSFKISTVACVIKGEFYGYRTGRDAKYDSLQAITNFFETENAAGRMHDEYMYHNNTVLPFVTYIFKHILHNDYGYTRQMVLNARNSSFKRTMFSMKGRCGSPIWTERYMTENVIYEDMPTKCDGHFLPFFLIMDRVLVGLADKYNSVLHWAMPNEDVPGQIKDNRRERKYTSSN